MSQINFILQGKGGVGKSVCSALLAQYKKSKSGEFPLCIDLDPINTSFKNFKAFKVEAPHILDEEKQNISQVAFDDVISKLLEAEESIVDAGTMTFTPLCGYLKSNDTFSLLAGGDGKDNIDNEIYVHVPIVAGEMFNDTIQGLQTILELPGPFQIIVWLNPMNGKVEESFNKTEVSQHEKITGNVTLPVLMSDTFGRDFKALLESKRTFEEALDDEKLSIIIRHRLKRIQKMTFDAIGMLPFI